MIAPLFIGLPFVPAAFSAGFALCCLFDREFQLACQRMLAFDPVSLFREV